MGRVQSHPGESSEDKDTLSSPREFLVFEAFRANEFHHHGIPEQIRVLSIIESPRHLLQVGGGCLTETLCHDPTMPRLKRLNADSILLIVTLAEIARSS
jgi:hypothetical protein